MSERLHPYRRRPSEDFERVRDEAQSRRFFVLQSIGPTGFVLRDEAEQKFRALIGASHSCSCGKCGEEHCVHTAFILLKVLRVPPDNPLCWQASLTEAEISEALKAREREEETRRLEAKRAERRQAAEAKKAARQNSKLPSHDDAQRKSIAADDMCPICYEPLLAENARQENSKEHQVAMRMLTFCKAECGNALHSQCMKVWADHRAQLGEDISCPLCRGKWPVQAIIELRRGASLTQRKQSTFWGRACKQCHMQPLRGVLHGCLLCDPLVQFCEACFLHPTNPTHTKHPFVKCSTPGGPWVPALRTVHDNMQLFRFREQHEQRRRQELAAVLADRELGPEDYELLQGLDRPASATNTPAVVAVDAEESLPEYLLRMLCEHQPTLTNSHQQPPPRATEPQGRKPTVADFLSLANTAANVCAFTCNGHCIDSASSCQVRLRCGHSAHYSCLHKACVQAFEGMPNETLHASWACPTCGKALLAGWTGLGLVEQDCPPKIGLRQENHSDGSHASKSPRRASTTEGLIIMGGGFLPSNSTSLCNGIKEETVRANSASASSSAGARRYQMISRRTASAGPQQILDLAVGTGPPMPGPSDDTLARRAGIQPLSELRLHSRRPRLHVAESNVECLDSATIVNDPAVQSLRRPPRAPSRSRPSFWTQRQT